MVCRIREALITGLEAYSQIKNHLRIQTFRDVFKAQGKELNLPILIRFEQQESDRTLSSLRITSNPPTIIVTDMFHKLIILIPSEIVAARGVACMIVIGRARVLHL